MNSETSEYFDMIDNDYFELNIYLVNETKKYYRDPDIKFIHCPENLE